jgi:hypothetical protein
VDEHDLAAEALRRSGVRMCVSVCVCTDLRQRYGRPGFEWNVCAVVTAAVVVVVLAVTAVRACVCVCVCVCVCTFKWTCWGGVDCISALGVHACSHL